MVPQTLVKYVARAPRSPINLGLAAVFVGEPRPNRYFWGSGGSKPRFLPVILASSSPESGAAADSEVTRRRRCNLVSRKHPKAALRLRLRPPEGGAAVQQSSKTKTRQIMNCFMNPQKEAGFQSADVKVSPSQIPNCNGFHTKQFSYRSSSRN